MQRPIDQADRSHLVHKAVLNGDYELKNILFQYGEEDPRPSLAIRHLKIRAGEKIGFWVVMVLVSRHCFSFYPVCRFQLKLCI
jgi:ATP-binding cassette subfamily C protein LapB